MKSATMPSIRVTPDFREALESVLKDGETISSFMEDSILREIEVRKSQSEFIKRGLAAREEAKRTGVYYTTDDVLAMMRSKLEKAKAKAAKAG